AAAAVERTVHERASLAGWLTPAHGAPLLVEGRLGQDAGLLDGRTQLVLDVVSVSDAGQPRSLDGRVRVTVGGEASIPVALEGDRVRVWTTLRAPRGFATPGARDTESEARREGVVAFGYCKSGRLMEVDASSRQPLAEVREAARRTLERFVGRGPEEGVVRAMLLGDRAGLDRETLERFRASGTYHVLALSGAQVALVASLLGFALRRMGLVPVASGPAIALALFAYACLVGADPPVMRAAVMASVLVLGLGLELDGEAANLLGLAAILLLLWRPSDVADPGFQLSFVATLGLIVIAPPLRSLLPRLPFRLELALAASAAAQLALAPLLVVHFHRLAPAALILNLAAVPLATAVLLLGAALAVLAPIVPASGPLLGVLAFAAARALLWTSQLAGTWRALDSRAPDPWFVALLVHGAGLVLLVRRRTRAGALLSMIGIALLAWGGPTAAGDGRLEVSVLDVGQGDAIVLRSPSGRHAVVDAGGSFDGRFDIGEAVVAPFLWRRGVREIDLLVLTHAHPDHVGGAPRLVRSFRVGEVWEGPAPRHDRGYAELDRALHDAGVARRTVMRGAVLDWDGVRIEVVGPPPPVRAPRVTRNDDSVVLRVGFGEARFLLTGDVEAAGEAALDPGDVSLLKVAHHGSRTSSSAGLLAAARPALAVISAGLRNTFGHPSPEALDRLRAAGARVFRTDQDGTVTIVTDGRSLRVISTRSRRDESLCPLRNLHALIDVLPSRPCQSREAAAADRDERAIQGLHGQRSPPLHGGRISAGDGRGEADRCPGIGR
ncbi:MAG TPA: DNA internalization-related competence protein ComEC/Rec2, partial [Vicinamibacteria bacterium]|nr:DNA internalization-related competence protein ComEC/Rec2 [Vicinamibacteria bacterium]